MSALDEEKTFTELQFVPLIVPDLSIRSTRKQLNFTTNSMHDWNMGYWNWKHQYRKRYSKKFLARYGFEPDVEGDSVGFDDTSFNAYMLAVDPDFKAGQSATTGMASPDMQMRYHLQNSGSPWSNRDSMLDMGGIMYHLDYVSYKEDGDPWTPDYHQIIIGHFSSGSGSTTIEITNLYGPNESLTVLYTRTSVGDDTEWFVHLVYSSSVPSGVVTTGMVTVTPIITLKEQGILIPETKGLRKMMRKLNVDADAFEETLMELDEDGQASIDNAYLVSGLPLRNPYEIFAKKYTPEEAERLPYGLLKEARDRNLDIGDAYNITEELASWWYYEHLREQSYLARGLFRSFAYYSGKMSETCVSKKNPSPRFLGNCVEDFEDNVGGNEADAGTLEDKNAPPIFGGLHITQGNLDIHYNYNVKVTTYQGRVRPDISDKRSQGTLHFSGTIIKSKDEDGDRDDKETWDSKGFDELKIQVQVDENSYQEMIITDYKCTYTLSGIKGEEKRIISPTLGYPPEEHKLIIPYFVLYHVRFTEYVTIYEHSLMFLAYAVKIVKVAFWKKFVGVLIAAVVCLVSYGSGCGIGALLYQAIIGYVVGQLVAFVLTMIDSEILQFVVQILGWMIQLYMGGFDFSAMTSEVWLKLAQQVGKMALGAFEAHLIKAEAERVAEEAAEERINEKMEYGDSTMSLSPATIMSAHQSFTEGAGVESYYNQALGNNLYNYDQYFDVTGEIDLRKQVVSG